MRRYLAPLALLLSVGSARADVSSPHAGMTLVRHASSAMVIANLCTPGVGVRATRYEERQATPQQWGEGVGVQAAINADFFDFPGWSYILVRARGAGQEWPASAELLEQPSSYWEFGPGVADIQPSSLVVPPANITEVVGAYDPLIIAGQPVDQSGNPFMLEFHRRSAIGLSADRSWVYLYASNASVNGPQMIGELVVMAAEGGAPPIDQATNQDGGGSSQLYVQGLGQVIDSGRQVNTHLGIYALGNGGAPNCPNHPPIGYLDHAACDGIVGWSQDPDAPDKSIDVHLYFNGVAGAPQATGIPTNAGLHRDDLCKPLGSCNHAFDVMPPLGLLDGKPHEVHAYGIDSSGGNNPELAQSPATLQCNALPITGVRRWIKSPEVMSAWHFTWFSDVMPVGDRALLNLREIEPIPDAPLLVHADDGSPEFWLVDGGKKRHIPDPAAAAAWHFDLTSAVTKPASYIHSLPTGLPLRERPIAVQGSGPAVYLLDDVVVPGTGDGGSSNGDSPAVSSGCGCRLTGAPSSSHAWWVAIGLWLLRRRRQT